MESFQEVIHVQTVFAVPTQLPVLWSWTWVSVALGVFALAAGSMLSLWIEHRHARRHPKAGRWTRHLSGPSNSLPNAA